MRFQKTQIIAVANQKGGCGKTTASVSLAAAFATLGYETCVVDIDPQCNSSETFSINPDALAEKGQFTVADAYLAERKASEIALRYEPAFDGKLSIVPGSRGLSSVYPLLTERMFQNIYEAGGKGNQIRAEDLCLLQRSLNSLRGVVDVVVIDTPPTLDFLTSTALIAADWIIVPVFPSGYDLSGLQFLLNNVDVYRSRFNPGLRLAGILLGAVDKTTVLHRDIYQKLIDSFGKDIVFRTTIARTVKFQEAATRQLTIFDHPEGNRLIENFIELAKELLSRSASSASMTPLPGVEELRRAANE